MRRILRQAIHISGRKRTWLMRRRIHKDNFQAQKEVPEADDNGQEGEDQDGEVEKAKNHPGQIQEA